MVKPLGSRRRRPIDDMKNSNSNSNNNSHQHASISQDRPLAVSSSSSSSLSTSNHKGRTTPPLQPAVLRALSTISQPPKLQPRSTSTAHMAPNTTRIPPFVIQATAIASMGGILFGYDMGVISGALPQLTDKFALSSRQQEVVVGSLYIGGGLGAAVGGTLCDALGRWTSIVGTDVLFALGAIVLVCAPTLPVLLVGRVLLGFAISVSGISDVAYLHELAPLQYRGAIVSVNEACISLGFLLAYVAGYTLNTLYPIEGWRVMFGISGVLALVQLLGMVLCMPESPVWLYEQGYTEQAQATLRVIYGDDAVQMEDHLGPSHVGDPPPPQHAVRTSSREPLMVVSDATTARYESLSKDNEGAHTTVISWRTTTAVLQHKLRAAWRVLHRYRKQGYIALFLSVFQQLSGQTVVLNYAPLLFSKLVVTSDDALESTLYIGIVKFVMTVLVIWKIESLGRRFLLLSGMCLTVVGLVLVTIAFATGISIGVEEKSGEKAVEADGKGMAFALPGVLCIVMGYSASFGPLTWLLTSELFPTDIRGRALGASTIVTYLCASVVTSTFLSTVAIIGAEGVFGLYALLTSLGMLFVHLAIPDTGGKSVAETEESLMRMWWWRGRTTVFDSNDRSEQRPVLEAELT